VYFLCVLFVYFVCCLCSCVFCVLSVFVCCLCLFVFCVCCLRVCVVCRHSGTPCINSAESLLACSERPNIYAALMAIRNKQGMNKFEEFSFPLVQQEFFANEAPNGIASSFPLVTKLSSVHAGFGKIRCANGEGFNDLNGLIAISSDYYTTEDLIENVVAEVYILQLGKVYAFALKIMDFVFKMIDFALKIMDFVFKMIDFALKLMDFVFKMIDFALKTVNFGRRSGAFKRRRI